MSTAKIVVAGAGPAGMMAAIRAAELGRDVTLIEKNPSPGKKLLLTGNGRCNFTNACKLDEFLSKFSTNGQFLRDAFKAFFNEDLIRFFRNRGVKIKIDQDNRVFPATDKAETVLRALTDELRKCGVKLICNKKIKKLLVEKEKVNAVILPGGSKISCSSVILAMGGVTYPSTGSSGDGLEIAKALGHRIVETRPGLVPLDIAEDCSALEGLSLRDIRICIRAAGRKSKFSAKGDMLFTRKGISGPLVLDHSGQIVDLLRDGKKISVGIDLMPDLDEEDLLSFLGKTIASHPKKSVKNLLSDLIPKRLITAPSAMTEVNTDKTANSLRADERKALAGAIKNMSFSIKRPASLNAGMITKGGVSVKDIDPRTMASRVIGGLYFAGEIIDVDGDSGGFNLQAAFSTGYLAGQSA